MHRYKNAWRSTIRVRVHAYNIRLQTFVFIKVNRSSIQTAVTYAVDFLLIFYYINLVIFVSDASRYILYVYLFFMKLKSAIEHGSCLGHILHSLPYSYIFPYAQQFQYYICILVICYCF